MAQSAPVPAAAASASKAQPADEVTTVVITGQRAALQSAQKIKQNSEEIVDSIVAADMKLPDRSVTEVLQRVVGVTIDRTMAKNDPEHFSVEGSGVMIRGLTWVRSELNGRDSFSANGGRSLNFEDVPPELLTAVDVYKNPSAEQIEGGIAGLVNLRTAMPFDYKGLKGAITTKATWSKLKGGKPTPEYSGLLSDSWDTSVGKFGALIDLAYSESATRTDGFQVEPYYPLTSTSGATSGQTIWVPKGAAWRTLNFDRKRTGEYAALQWKNNSGLESSLTYFKSKYKMQWDENAIFAQSSPYNITVDPGATFNSQNVLQTGVLRDATDGGINFGADTRVANRNSKTGDLAWNLKWKASDKWSFSSDLQLIRATTDSFDSTVATGVQLPKETVNLSGSMPHLLFDDADRTYLADPANYYWAFTQEHKDKSSAHENAWRGDAEYQIDNPILNSFRFGVRLTERGALTQNSNPSYNWAAITQPWQIGWDINHLAYLNDPRFSGNTHLHTFNNFFNGKQSVPSLIFPDTSVAAGYPDSYTALHKYHDILCAEETAANGWGSGCPAWQAATFGTDPSGTNDQQEHTQAAYGQLRFGFDDLQYPIEGNVGMRYIHTNARANGYTVLTPATVSIPAGGSAAGLPVPIMAPFSQAGAFQHSYDNILPSLNLKMKASEKLQFRLAFASAISRPDFSDMQAYTTLAQKVTSHNAGNQVIVDSVSYTGTANGNPMLKPVKSNQLDLSGEWYFAPTGSFTVAAFDKELRDIIVNQTSIMSLPDINGGLHDFTVTSPINGAKGTARGVEVAFQTYFSSLPGFLSGFGVQANYTFVDSHRTLYSPVNQAYCTGGNSAANVNLNLNGCDTDGRTFGNLPLANLSRNSFNLTLMYDQGPLSARMAYSWRSKSLQAVNVNGTNGSDGTDTNPNSSTLGQHNVGWGLPTWADSYGQVDASVSYKITESLTFGLEGQNLFNATYRQLMQQHVGMMGRAWFATGPRYTAQMSYSF
jgi:TonB-dependent receptor